MVGKDMPTMSPIWGAVSPERRRLMTAVQRRPCRVVPASSGMLSRIVTLLVEVVPEQVPRVGLAAGLAHVGAGHLLPGGHLGRQLGQDRAPDFAAGLALLDAKAAILDQGRAKPHN